MFGSRAFLCALLVACAMILSGCFSISHGKSDFKKNMPGCNSEGEDHYINVDFFGFGHNAGSSGCLGHCESSGVPWPETPGASVAVQPAVQPQFGQPVMLDGQYGVDVYGAPIVLYWYYGKLCYMRMRGDRPAYFEYHRRIYHGQMPGGHGGPGYGGPGHGEPWHGGSGPGAPPGNGHRPPDNPGGHHH